MSLLDAVANQLDPPESRWARDPAGWIRQHTFVWSKQAEVAEAVRDERFVAVRACHGPGKSFIAGWIAAWWIATHEDAMVVTSAPSSNQVKNILWKEIDRAREIAGLPGHITGGDVPEWKIAGEVVGFGRKPQDRVSPEKAATPFQGHHATHILVILDEGSGIPTWLANATETLVTNDKSRVLMIGNPDDPNSYFAKVQQPNGGYHPIKISYWDTPAHTGEPVPQSVADKLVSKLWMEERRRRWGVDSMLWTAKVDAEFPEVSEDRLFTPSIIAKGKRCDREPYKQLTKGHAGFDIARYGSDQNVVYLQRQGYTRLVATWSKTDLEKTVGRFISLWGPQATEIPGVIPTTNIDTTGGLGAGPHDRLRALGYPVVEFNASERAYNPKRFKNRRAEAYWEAVEAMDDGVVDIDELDEELQQELLETKFFHTSTGQIQLEDKEEIKKRLGHSPDRADAFVMSLQERADWMRILDLGDKPPGPADASDSPKPPTAADLVSDVMDVPL